MASAAGDDASALKSASKPVRIAALEGRSYVIPDDIKYLVPAVITHRLIVHPEAELRGRNAAAIVSDLLNSTPLGLGSVK